MLAKMLRLNCATLRRISDSAWRPVTYIVESPVPDRLMLRSKVNSYPEGVLHYLGLEPNRSLSCSKNIRFGNRGSLSVCVEEEKCGVWYNFETGESGDMLDMIKKIKGVGEDEAFDIAKSLIEGNTLEINSLENHRERKEDVSNTNREVLVKKIISECLPLKGTIAERYLKTIRKLKNIPSESLYFHPELLTKDLEGKYMKVPGLVCLASHPQSPSPNIQITYLDPDTGGKHKRVSVSRRTFGSFGNESHTNFCSLSQQELSNDVTYVSEGIETGLSVLQSRPESHVIATLGKNNFPKLDPSLLASQVVLLWDNDGIDVRKDRTLRRTVKQLVKGNKKIYLVIPPILPDKEKTDLNDILMEKGRDEMERIIKNNMMKVEVS